MKHILVLFFLFMIIACKQAKDATSNPTEASVEKERKNIEFMANANEPYQKFSPHVMFIIDTTDQAKSQLLIKEQNQFIQSSGLPHIRTMFDWVSKKDVKETREHYENFIKKNSDHRFIKVFKQYEGWLLLSRFNLLSSNNEENLDFAKLLVNDLIETEYKGYGLLYYAIKHLLENEKLNRTEIIIASARVKNYSEKSANYSPNKLLNDKEIMAQRGKPLPPEMIEMINNHRSKSIEERTLYVSKIEGLVF